jgi:hypothetical protein
MPPEVLGDEEDEQLVTKWGPQSPSIEPAPNDSRAPVTEQVESSLEIPETPEITLEKMQREEDSHSEDGNTPSHFI